MKKQRATKFKAKLDAMQAEFFEKEYARRERIMATSRDRGSFLQATIHDGYVYLAERPNANVGPAAYSQQVDWGAGSDRRGESRPGQSERIVHAPNGSSTARVRRKPATARAGSRSGSRTARGAARMTPAEEEALQAESGGFSEAPVPTVPALSKGTIAFAKTAPRQAFRKTPRFANTSFVSKRLQKAQIGTLSPGPVYYPKGHELSTVRAKRAKHTIPFGRWCP